MINTSNHQQNRPPNSVRPSRRSTFRQVGLSLGLLAIFALGVGCERAFDSKTPVSPIPTPPATPGNLSATLIDNGAILRWTVSDTTGIDGYRIYISETGADGNFTPEAFTGATSRTFTNLVTGRTYHFRVTSVTDLGFEGEKSSATAITVGLFSITIDNDALITRSRDVSVSFFTQGGALALRLSEDSTMNGAVWQSFSSRKNFKLSEGDGTKWLYANLQFADGSSLETVLSDSITLDTKVTITGLALSETEARLQWTPTESTDFASYRLHRSLSSSVTESDFLVVAITSRNVDSYIDDQLTDNTTYYYRLYVHNLTEPSSSSNTASITTPVNLPPEAVTLGGRLDSASVVLTWSLNTDADFASYDIYRHTSSNFAVTPDRRVGIVNIQSVTEFRLQSSGTTYYYKVLVVDRLGLFATSNETLKL